MLCVPPGVHGIIFTVSEKTITGRIIESGTTNGIPNLTVKLTSPRASKRPQKITTTDQNGSFKFMEVEPAKYLIEVYQGVNPIYRDVVDTNVPGKREITLTRKKPK